MKGIGIFMCSLLVIDTFAASYYIGMHSRTVPIEDPKLPPVVKKVQVQEAKPEEKPVAEKTKPAETKKATKASKAKNSEATKTGKTTKSSKSTKSSHH